VSLQQQLDQLQPRERRLLAFLVGLFAIFVLLLVPVGLHTMLATKRSFNDTLRDTITSIQKGREKVRKREAEREAILNRYAKPAPPLAELLEKLANQNKVEIPETRPQATIPHGADYDEKPTKIVLRKVGMYALAKFMEGIARSGHPVTISRLNIRKRAVEPDSYDVEMVVSAFERKVAEKPAKSGTNSGAAGATSLDEEPESPEVEP
jgi:general secretion pathway protein M